MPEQQLSTPPKKGNNSCRMDEEIENSKFQIEAGLDHSPIYKTDFLLNSNSDEKYRV
jgi:hypothetical protein